MAERSRNSASTLKLIADKVNTKDVPKLIEISKLQDFPDNEYLFGMPQEAIEHMAEGIKKNDFRGAIEVWSLDNGEYLIYSGHIRKEAMKLLGEEKIKCFIYPLPEKETQQKRLLLGANLYGRNAINADDAIHTARQIKYMREILQEEGFTGDYRNKLAEEFGTSASNIQRYEAILNLNPSAQEKVQDGTLQVTVAASIGTMDQEVQAEAIKAIEALKEEKKEAGEKVTRDTMRSVISEVKKTGNAETALENLRSSQEQKEAPVTAEDIKETEYAEDEEESEKPIEGQVTFNVPSTESNEMPREATPPGDENEIKYINNFITHETEYETVYEDQKISDQIAKLEDALTNFGTYSQPQVVISKLEALKKIIDEEIARISS